jgi:hypothetical protein
VNVRWSLIGLTLALAGHAGGCKREAPTPPAAAAKVPNAGLTQAAPLPEAVSSAVDVSPADDATPAAVPSYGGPQSESRDHFSVTMGFQDADGKPTARPKAVDTTKFYISVLDPASRPVGQLAKVADAELHAFLVARDLRQALYANASGPAKPGADARAVRFSPREGGDHALLSVFQPAGGRLRVVASPVAISGALPQVAGPGVAGLSERATVGKKSFQLETLPAAPQAGRALRLTLRQLDARGQPAVPAKWPFLVLLNDELGWGDVVTCDDQGAASWLPPAAGTYLVLAPPTSGEQPLLWKLAVVAPAPAAR